MHSLFGPKCRTVETAPSATLLPPTPPLATEKKMYSRRGRPLDRAISFSNISIQSSGLYDFQESAILFLELPDDIYDQDHGFKRRFLNLAPGLGKTVVERHFISSKPKGYKVLFLVPSGLVEQTAELLSAHSSTQRHLCVKGANNCQEYLDALQAQPDVLVLNVSLKADYASYYWKFNLVVVDEAQKRLGFCAKLAKSLKCDLHFLSGSALTWFHIPFSVPVFRFDKTPTVIEQAMLASVKINVAPIATEDSHLTDYLDALGRMLTEHSPEVASSLFFLLLAATEKHPQLNRVWTQPMRRNFASGVLACFGMTVEKWRSKRTSLRNYVQSGCILRLERLTSMFPGINTVPYYLGPEATALLAVLRQRTTEPADPESHPSLLHAATQLHGEAVTYLPSHFDTVLPNVTSALQQKSTVCPRILLRAENVKSTVQYLIGELPMGVIVLPLSTGLSARTRENVIRKFKGADGAQYKMEVLRRSSQGGKTVPGAAGRVLSMWGGGFLNLLEGLLVQPRIIVADGAGNLGFDLHRHITALISNKFLPTYSDILQFCGRASRLAPACGQQPHLTLQMCLRESTLDELLFLPSARAEAKSVRERGG